MAFTCRSALRDAHYRSRRVGKQVVLAAIVAVTSPQVARAAEDSAHREDPDRYEVWAQGETHAALFQRALLPGPNGALVSTDTVAPLRQYVLLRARNIDTSWAKDSVDTELSAWGNVTLGNIGSEHVLDGDVQVANVGYRQGPLSFRLGRQHVAGGAARYARFDGASAHADIGGGLDAGVYGGFTVLPRWNERPGYQYLGAAVDSDLRNPSALPPPSRGSHYLFGGRLGYTLERFSAGLSIHDQWEQGGLSRFDVGADSHFDLSQMARLGGSAILAVDARRFADARLFVDMDLGRRIDASLEYLHTEPALLLSRQSVLAVFSTDSYEEMGGTVAARATNQLSFEGAAFAQLYDTGRMGGRAEVASRIVSDRSRNLTVRIGYTRVQAPINGYHSLRTSLVKRIVRRVSGTLEAYGYFYDEAVAGIRTSLVYAGTLSAVPTDGVVVLLGASVARSPYAALDAQTQLRLSYDFDLAPGRRTE